MSESAKAGCVVVSVLILLIVFVACGIGGCVFDKANKHVGINASITKYEEFKTIAAKLDAKKASIEVAEHRTRDMDKQYQGVPRKDWPRSDLEQYNLWRSEVAGMKASYNSLCADFNARMAMVHYKYANVGELPQGAEKPLPREYKPYDSE